MTNRKKAEEIILSNIKKLAPNSKNADRYKDLFASMSDKEFSNFIDRLESGSIHLVLECANLSNSGLSVQNNLDIAKSLGIEFFQKLWLTNKDGSKYLSPVPYMVIDLPLRRASQTLEKKVKLPENNAVIDTLTGQPTGASKGAKISYPELQVCAAMNLDNSMVEFIKYRGGDAKGGFAMNAMLTRYGSASIKALEPYASGVQSVKTLKTFLTSMLLKNTL